jgi:hypothetical protein
MSLRCRPMQTCISMTHPQSLDGIVLLSIYYGHQAILEMGEDRLECQLVGLCPALAGLA